jgi:hypothetical protein
MERSGAKGSGTMATPAQAGRAENFIYQSVFSMLDTGILCINATLLHVATTSLR